MIHPKAGEVWAFGVCYHDICYASDCRKLVGLVRQVAPRVSLNPLIPVFDPELGVIRRLLLDPFCGDGK
jgi:hypothetical protein